MTGRKKQDNAGGDSITPMMRQYQQIKQKHPEELLLFRLGDFYETFGEDAKQTAEILNIALTRKHVGKGKTLPLAGIPYHALDTYLAKLIRAGKRVAICEQTEDPKKAKGLVARDVVRIVTPGTIIEEGVLEEKSANYLVAVARHQGNWGLAVADLSTGRLGATEFSGEDSRSNLMAELARIQPAEMLATEADWNMLENGLRETFGAEFRMVRTRADNGMVRLDRARSELMEQLNVATLQGYGAEDSPAAVCSAGALVTYLRETQRQGLGHIRDIRIYSIRDTMLLDATTQRSLELVRNLIDGGRSTTLLDVLDHTRTPMGGRLLREWIMQPLQSIEEIAARQDSIDSLIESTQGRGQLADSLRGVRDMERIIGRIHCGAANARDLVSLSNSLREAPSIKSALLRFARGRLKTLGEFLQTHAGLANRLDSVLVPEPPVTVREGGMIQDGVRQDLDELREISRGGKGWIAELRAREVERTGIGNLKIGYNRVFGYYIEVSKSHTGKVPENYVRRQTLTNGERYITPELKEKEDQILGAQDKIYEIEFELFQQVIEEVKEQTAGLQALAAQFSEIDVLASLAEAAIQGGYVRPEVNGSDVIEIDGGRHPVLESLMIDSPFIANDTKLDNRTHQILLITGPNMAGKSTYIRQVALLTLMAHVGSFVPARRAKFGLVDRIFTRVGATDYLARGQSTFMVEMTETANILNNATDKSLVILDEIGRGTSTYDGLSIAWAVVEYLHGHARRRAKSLFATHYHELVELEGRLERVKNFNVAVHEAEDRITFLYHIVPGGADRSYGIYAAQLAGMPQETLSRAREILFALECKAGAPDEGVVSGDKQNLPAVRGGKSALRRMDFEDVDIMQMDLFAPALPPALEQLADLDVNSLTPIQSMQILSELVEAIRRMKG